MGNDNPQTTQTKKDTKPDHYDNAGEPSTDRPNVTAVRDSILRQLHDNPTAPQASPQKDVDAHLDILGRELNALGQLGDRRSGLFRDGKGTVHDVHQIVEDADNHFQTLALAAQDNAKGSAGQMWQAMKDAGHYADRMTDLQQKLKTELSPDIQKQLGINFDQPLTADQIHNAVIKSGLDNGTTVTTDPKGEHLTEYLTLSEMSNLATQVDKAVKAGNQAEAANKLPALVNLAYADFLMQYKDGVSLKHGPDGKPFAVTAASLVDKISEADMKALPGSQETKEQAAKTDLDLMRSHGITDDKNPLVPLLEGQKKNDVGLLQKAADLSKDDKFDPEKTVPEWNANQKAITDLQQSVGDRQPTADEIQKMQGLVGDNAVLKRRMTLRSDSFQALGEAELKQKDPDILKAKQDLLTAIQSDPRKTPDKTDPNYKPENDPVLRWQSYSKQMTAIEDGQLLGKHPELKDVLQQTEANPDFMKTVQGAVTDQEAYQNMLKQHGQGGKPPTDDEMAQMKKTLDSWSGQADAAQRMIGNAGPAIDKAFQELSAKKDNLTAEDKNELDRLRPLYAAAHQKTLADMEEARFSARTGHVEDAKEKMAEAGKDSTLMADPAVKQQADAYNAGIKQAQFDNSPWYSRWGNYIGGAVAAAAVPVLAWGAGALLAPETGGLSLAAAAAITAGVGVGAGAIGTAAGAGLEKLGGARDSYWDAVKDVAPTAMTVGGLATGLASFAAPALATGEVAATATGATTAAEGLQTGAAAAKAASWIPGASKIPFAGRMADFMATKTIFTPANQINLFANIAKGGEALPAWMGAARPVAAYVGANALGNAAMMAPGAIGIAATSDHPFTDSLSAIGASMAAAPLRVLGPTTGSLLPRGLQTIGGLALPVAAGVGADYAKNLALAPFDSRGGDASVWDKAWLPTYIDATKALPAGIFVPGISGMLSNNNRDEALRAAELQAAAEKKAAQADADDDQKQDK